MAPPAPRPWAARVRYKVFSDIDAGLGGASFQRGRASTSRGRLCARAAAVQAARGFRHMASCEKEKPSRRNRSPISPTSGQRSAAAKILRLSPLENCRRLAVAATSGSVAGGARAECGAYIETVL